MHNYSQVGVKAATSMTLKEVLDRTEILMQGRESTCPSCPLDTFVTTFERLLEIFRHPRGWIRSGLSAWWGWCRECSSCWRTTGQHAASVAFPAPSSFSFHRVTLPLTSCCIREIGFPHPVSSSLGRSGCRLPTESESESGVPETRT